MTKMFRLTPRAKDDLMSIGRYTLRKWGKKQRNRYLHELDERFQWLAEQPHMGKHRPDIEVDENYYCYLQGSHIIFYLIHDEGIDIIGIPHQSMDIIKYFRMN